MEQLTMWKLLSGATLVIGFLVRVLLEQIKKNKGAKESIYICPLDRTGFDGKLNSISGDVDKNEVKLNKIITVVDYNKSFIEQIHSRFDEDLRRVEYGVCRECYDD